MAIVGWKDNAPLVFGLAALSGACVSSPTVGGSRLTGRVQGGVQVVETEDSSSAGFVQNYDVGLEDAVRGGVDYRVGLRTVLNDTSLSGERGGGSLTTRTYEPSLDLAWRNGTLDLETGMNSLLTDQGASGASTTKFRRENLFSRIGWNPAGLPAVRLGLEKTRLGGSGSADSDETEWELQVDHTLGAWQLTYAATLDDRKDRGAGNDRRILQQIGRVDYQQTLDEEGTVLTAGALVDDSREKNTFDDGTSALPPLAATQGLFAIDDTPQTVVLASLPALIDGDLVASTGVNIGGALAGGGTDRNLGVDLGLARTVAAVRIQTDVSVSVQGVRFYSWSVWRSEDNQLWTRVTAAAAFVYDPFLRRFQVSFPFQSTRYLKVVNETVPLAEPAVFVTEMVALGSVVTSNASATSKRRIETGHGSLRWVPWEGLDVTGSVLLSRTSQTDRGLTTRDEGRTNLGLSARYQPQPQWDISLSGSTDRTRDPATVDREDDFVSGLFSYRPWEGFEASFAANRRVRFEDDVLDSSGTSAGVRLGLEMGSDVSSSLEVSRLESRDVDAGTRTELWSMEFQTFSRLTERWQLNLQSRWDRANVLEGDPSLATPTFLIVTPELIYRVGSKLIASGELEYRGGDGPSGLFHRYRLDWLPFTDGTLDMEVNWSFEIIPSPVEDRRQGLLARIQWNVTQSSFFEILGTDQRASQGAGDRVQTLQLTYNLSF